VLSALIEWWTWGVLTPLIIAVDRKLPFYGERSLVHLLMHLVLGPLWILIFTFSSESICWSLGLQQWGHLFANFRQGMFWTMLIYLLIVGVSEADLFRQRHLSAELRMQRLGKNLSDAKLQALRMQLDPHFLFNALNTISAEVTGDPRLARKMIEHLGDLLRSSLELRDRPEVKLADEIDLLNHFIAIQKVRFGDDLRISINVPIEVRSQLVPSLLLQPLVENAIRHGITPRVGGGTVTIEAVRLDDHLRLSVSDDGVGLSPGWSLADQVGLGLALTTERIAGLYPDTKARLSIGPREGGGTEVVVLLPIRENQDEVGLREST
jgi:two-component system LytT family sensor kinase